MLLARTRDIFFPLFLVLLKACYYFSFSSSSLESNIHALHFSSYTKKSNARSMKKTDRWLFFRLVLLFFLRSMRWLLLVCPFFCSFFLCSTSYRVETHAHTKKTKRSNLFVLLLGEANIKNRIENERTNENEREKRRKKQQMHQNFQKKNERIRFVYIVYLGSLERCHEADVVSLIGRWSERQRRGEKKKKIRCSRRRRRRRREREKKQANTTNSTYTVDVVVVLLCSTNDPIAPDYRMVYNNNILRPIRIHLINKCRHESVFLIE